MTTIIIMIMRLSTYIFRYFRQIWNKQNIYDIYVCHKKMVLCMHGICMSRCMIAVIYRQQMTRHREYETNSELSVMQISVNIIYKYISGSASPIIQDRSFSFIDDRRFVQVYTSMYPFSSSSKKNPLMILIALVYSRGGL